MLVFGISDLLNLFNSAKLIFHFQMVFVLIGLEYFDSILGDSQTVFSGDEAFNSSKIGVFLGLFDDWIVLEGFDVVH